MTSRFYPSCLNVAGRRCLVVGDSAEMAQKARRLAAAGARVRLVPLKKFSLSQLRGQFFVLLGIKDNPRLTRSIHRACRRQKILLCALDQPEFCDIINVSVYDRGPLHIMVSTDGVSPALSKKIRLGLE